MCLTAAPWTVACWAPPSMGFSRQEARILKWVTISFSQGSSGRLLTVVWATTGSSCDGRISPGCFTLRPASSQGTALQEGLCAASGLRVGPGTGSCRKGRSLTTKMWLIIFPVDQWGQNSSVLHLWGKECIFLCGSVIDKPRRHLI